MSKAFLQAREQVQDLVQLFLIVGLAAEEAAHHQVFFHSQAGKHPATFRHHGNALAHDARSVLADQLFTLVADAATARLGRAAEGHQQGRLAGTVGADQGDNLTLTDFDVDVMQRLNLAVEGGNVLEIQHHASPR